MISARKKTHDLSNLSLRISVVIILYNYDEPKVAKMIEILQQDNLNIILVDNTPLKENSLFGKLALNNKKLYYTPLLENKGIATAQNIGIHIAKSIEGISYVLFLDQDSLISDNFVQLLYNEYVRIKKNGEQIAVLSPTLINEKTNLPYKRKKLIEHNGYFRTDKVSSSGSLISLETFNIVGEMEENLFIDLVDSEWCWRSKKHKLSCVITQKVFLLHPIGESNKKVLGYDIIISAPFRYYYQYRNWIKMLPRSYVPIEWKVKTTIKYLFFMIYYPVCVKNGVKYLKHMIKGIISIII